MHSSTGLRTFGDRHGPLAFPPTLFGCTLLLHLVMHSRFFLLGGSRHERSRGLCQTIDGDSSTTVCSPGCKGEVTNKMCESEAPRVFDKVRILRLLWGAIYRQARCTAAGAESESLACVPKSRITKLSFVTCQLWRGRSGFTIGWLSLACGNARALVFTNLRRTICLLRSRLRVKSYQSRVCGTLTLKD